MLSYSENEGCWMSFKFLCFDSSHSPSLVFPLPSCSRQPHRVMKLTLRPSVFFPAGAAPVAAGYTRRWH